MSSDYIKLSYCLLHYSFEWETFIPMLTARNGSSNTTTTISFSIKIFLRQKLLTIIFNWNQKLHIFLSLLKTAMSKQLKKGSQFGSQVCSNDVKGNLP